MPSDDARSLSFSQTAIASVLSPILLLTVIIFYRIFLHSLSRVPGPRLAAFSNLWHAYQVRRGRMLELAKRLHKEYGPVVRIGPNEVWFSSVDAYKALYGANGGFEKSNFYLATLLNKPRVGFSLQLKDVDTLDLLSERNMKRYRVQRRLIGPVYQASNVKKWEGAVDKVLERVIPQLKALGGAEVELKEWMHIIVVECLGTIVLSWSPGYLAEKTDFGSSSHGYLAWRRRSVFGLFPVAAVGETYFPSLARLFANIWRVSYSTPKGFKPFFPGVYRQIKRRVDAELRGDFPKKEKQDLLSDLIHLYRTKNEFTESYLRRMAMTNFGAGHETLTSTLTSILAMVGTHSEVRNQVLEELDRHEAVGGDLAAPHHTAYTYLPYTHACIKEAMRLYPVVGMSISRKVPASGLALHGYYFPPGTTVGCNPLSLHRNTDIFGSDADLFNPDRWLGAGAGAGAFGAMGRCSLTWGGGARTCPGRYLAEMVVNRVVPTLLREFDLEITMPPEEEIRLYYVAMLTGVKVRFTPRIL